MAAEASSRGTILNLEEDFMKTLNLRLVSYLGSGATGQVVEASPATTLGESWALKTFFLDKHPGQDTGKEGMTSDKDKKLLAAFHREVNVMKNLDHPNVAKFITAAVCPGSLVIAMKHYPNGSLLTHMGRMTNSGIDTVFSGLVTGLDYLHKVRVVHGDIKLQNIMLDHHNQPVLIDFGMSKLMVKDVHFVESSGGTIGYFTPEVLARANKIDPFKCDVFAAGVVMRCLLLNKRPHYDVKVYLKEVKNANQIPEKLRYYLSAMLCDDPAKRPTMSQIQTALVEIPSDSYKKDLNQLRKLEDSNPHIPRPKKNCKPRRRLSF